jgi:hypothetical protein
MAGLVGPFLENGAVVDGLVTAIDDIDVLMLLIDAFGDVADVDEEAAVLSSSVGARSGRGNGSGDGVAFAQPGGEATVEDGDTALRNTGVLQGRGNTG